MYIHYCTIIGVYYDILDSFLFIQDREKVGKVAFNLCSEHSESRKVYAVNIVYYLLINLVKYVFIIKNVISLFFTRLGNGFRHALSVLP